jgi:spore coat protein U-like protein
LVTLRSASVPDTPDTVVLAVAELFVLSASVPALVTLALLMRGETALAVGWTTMTTLPALFKKPRNNEVKVQVTVPATCVQLLNAAPQFGTLGVAETNVTPAGSVSVTTTAGGFSTELVRSMLIV